MTAATLARRSSATLLLTFAASLCQADVVNLDPVLDATLYEDGAGSFANGSGEHFFAGRNNSALRRRALLSFDIAGAIPAGSTINSASLRLYVSRTAGVTDTTTLHRVLAAWGEGASNALGNEGGGTDSEPGDATWIHTDYPSGFWSNAGGDYNGILSAQTTVGGLGFKTWSSAAMASDVQAWLDSPAGNFGWILVGDDGAGNRTAKRYDSRSNPSTGQRPLLTIDYTPAIVDGACCESDDTCTIGTDTDCATLGGTFQGVGVSCSPDPCVLPTGACCAFDGTCTELALQFCDAAGGTHLGNGSNCTPGICPDPTGSCCEDDGTCSNQTEIACMGLGGSYGGDGSDCGDVVCPVILEPYVDALPIPAVAQPDTGTAGGAASYEIAVTEFQQQLHRDLPPTTVWGYDGTFPGPTIEAAAYETVTVTWVNDLRDSMGALRTEHFLPVDLCPHGPNHLGPSARTVVHLHGAHVREEFDGYPEDTILPGEQQVYVYTNDQLPATLWYHDHALGITRLNVYLGLAGFYLIRDPLETSLGLPAGPYEIPLVIQDRTFASDGSFVYPAAWQDHFFGDTVLVNGKVWPFLDVDQGKYRFRLLNGSGSRTYTFGLSQPGMQFQQIGTDGGLLPAPVNVTELTLGPAERADVILDFTGMAPGTEILMTNSAPAPFSTTGGPGAIPDVMKFVVTSQTGHTAAIPASLRPMEVLQEADSVATRDFELIMGPDDCTGTAWTINGLRWDDITEYPFLDTTEIWRFINRSGAVHPMHMHLVMFQVLDRQPFEMMGGVPTPTGPAVPPPPNEAGWKDTVQSYPFEITRVIARFEDYTGKFAYHCHILEHEDQEMMRQFQTVRCGDKVVSVVEECDDGNAIGGDGCSTMCSFEESFELYGTALGGTVQIVVDGVTIYGITSFGQSAEQVVANLVSSILSNSTLALRGVTARAEGNALIVNSELGLTNIGDNGLTDRLWLGVGPASIWWTRTEAATIVDLVSGDLGTLRASGGDYALATQTCVTDNETAAYLAWTDAPASGQGTWYLLRAPAFTGTYDSDGNLQEAPRDGGIAASGNDCP